MSLISNNKTRIKLRLKFKVALIKTRITVIIIAVNSDINVADNSDPDNSDKDTNSCKNY